MLANDRVDLVTCTVCYGMFDRLITDGICPYCMVTQLEAELEILKTLDIKGLKVIATELAKTEPPYKWTSMWRDCGIRQSTIGKQLLRLCDKLGGEG